MRHDDRGVNAELARGAPRSLTCRLLAMSALMAATDLASHEDACRGTRRSPLLKWLGRVEYEPTWRSMQRLTDQRDTETRDEIWFLEHPPVFTLGLNASREHVLAPADIPVV